MGNLCRLREAYEIDHRSVKHNLKSALAGLMNVFDAFLYRICDVFVISSRAWVDGESIFSRRGEGWMKLRNYKHNLIENSAHQTETDARRSLVQFSMFGRLTTMSNNVLVYVLLCIFNCATLVRSLDGRVPREHFVADLSMQQKYFACVPCRLYFLQASYDDWTTINADQLNGSWLHVKSPSRLENDRTEVEITEFASLLKCFLLWACFPVIAFQMLFNMRGKSAPIQPPESTVRGMWKKIGEQK